MIVLHPGNLLVIVQKQGHYQESVKDAFVMHIVTEMEDAVTLCHSIITEQSGDSNILQYEDTGMYYVESSPVQGWILQL